MLDALAHSLQTILSDAAFVFTPQDRSPRLLPCVVVASAAFTRAPLRTASDTVTLPIRVMQPDGNVVSVTVEGTNASYAQTLYLHAHRIQYRSFEGFTVDKASIRLNGGRWVDLNDDVVVRGGPWLYRRKMVRKPQQ